MKKIMTLLTLIVSFAAINTVKAADSTDLFFTLDTESFVEYKELLGNENFNLVINDLLDKYKSNYMSSYPYFIISPQFVDNGDGIYLNIVLSYYEDIPTMPWAYSQGGSNIGVYAVYTRLSYDESNLIGRNYLISTDSISLSFDLNEYEEYIPNYLSGLIRANNGAMTEDEYYLYNPYLYYMSNFDLKLESLSSLESKISSAFIFDYDTLMLPKINETGIYDPVNFDSEEYIFEPYYLYDEEIEVTLPNFTEINLNDYSYVALALKDYNQEDAFTTTVQVKGQYCITPVYEFGLKPYDEISESRVQNICSPYYSNYTPVVTTITESNLKNKSIYYIKAYDTSKENYIKVDNTVFDISYITEEEKDNPYVLVDGKYYPTIAYDNLPSSATQNTDEGYVPGASEDFVGIMIDDFTAVFEKPLEVLQSLWDSITTMFGMIFDFYELLPADFQSFLKGSFMLAIVIGLIKIIC